MSPIHISNATMYISQLRGGASSSDNLYAIQQLAQQYNLDLPTNPETNQLSKKYNSILLSPQTTLQEALQKANADARFLIVYISKKGGSSSNNKNDGIVIPNLLSPSFIKLANRKPLGSKQSGTTSSYYVWVANSVPDKEAEVAMKRLKLKPPTSSSAKKSKKKSSTSSAPPILAIIYPATTIDHSGKLKVSPRSLAQHHCHPPPTSTESLGNWCNTIRKRHVRDYVKLQHDQKELQLMAERTKGYSASIKDDKAREEKEEEERARKAQEEEKERLRLEALEERRKLLLESLEEEPEAGGDGVITIALRFATTTTTKKGTGAPSDRRRFNAQTTTLNSVFNWIDATFGIERETIELSTMNGQKVFRYVEEDEEEDEEEEDLTLKEIGLGKMTALRVTEIVEEEEECDEEDGEESESDDDDDDEEDIDEE